MNDNLTIFGTNYTSVTGIKAKGTGNGTLTYVRPTGTKSITANGTGIDVASYASVDVAVPTGGGSDWPVFTSNDEATTITCDKTYAECRALIQDGVTGAILNTPSLSAPLTAMRVEDGEVTTTVLRYVFIFNGIPQTQVNYANDGTITIQQGVDTVTTLTVTSNGTYTPSNYEVWNSITVNVPSGSPFLQSKTVTPTESQQTVSPDSGYDGLSSVTVNAIPSTYVGSGVTQRTSSDLTASGATVTVPAGYYSSQASKAVASGTEGKPTATKGAVSNHSVTVTPSVTNSAGYIVGGTHSGTAVTVSASELVSGSTTITENGTTDVTNLASVTVDIDYVEYHISTSTPASSDGADGDIWLVTA